MGKSAFPNGVVSWADRQDDFDDVSASDINNAYAEIIAIEKYLSQMTVDLPSNIIMFADWIEGGIVSIIDGTTPQQNTAPSITSVFNTTIFDTSTNITIPYVTSDTEGGLFKATYSINGVSTVVSGISSFNNTWNVGVLSAGDYVLTIRVQDNGGLDSNILTFSITVADVPLTVSANLGSGTYYSSKNITLAASKAATIYYTVDGSTPTQSSQVYLTPITIGTTTTLKFYAVDSHGNATSIQTETYTIIIAAVYDTFDRSDNGSAIGTANTGQTWTTLSGTMGVSANRAMGSSNDLDIAIIDAGIADVDISVNIHGVMAASASDVSAWIGLRQSDTSHYILVEIAKSSFSVQQWNGSKTFLIPSTSITYVDGAALRVVAKGSNITVYYNGTQVGTCTSSVNQTIKTHGLGFWENTGVMTMDNFVIKAA